jgi:hypothetical protein
LLSRVPSRVSLTHRPRRLRLGVFGRNESVSPKRKITAVNVKPDQVDRKWHISVRISTKVHNEWILDQWKLLARILIIFLQWKLCWRFIAFPGPQQECPSTSASRSLRDPQEGGMDQLGPVT